MLQHVLRRARARFSSTVPGASSPSRPPGRRDSAPALRVGAVTGSLLAVAGTVGAVWPQGVPVGAANSALDSALAPAAVDRPLSPPTQAQVEAEAKSAALVARQAEVAKAQAERAAKERAAEAAARASRDSRRDPRSAARSLLPEHGWGAAQFGCLDALWAKESGWKHTAHNSSSGAYGIPQALPGSKMASAGPDWRTNPLTQMRWGLQYIDDVYGSPCAAWSHSRASNWY